VVITVNISDLGTSNSNEDKIITYSLGSCVGVSLYDPVAEVGSLIHCMLPLSKVDRAKSKIKPYMFVDTGLQAQLKIMYDNGATKKNIVAKVAGGSKLLDKKSLFRIGERNYTVVRKILWKNNILIENEDVGGTKSRTMYLVMETGKTYLKIRGEEIEL